MRNNEITELREDFEKLVDTLIEADILREDSMSSMIWGKYKRFYINYDTKVRNQGMKSIGKKLRLILDHLGLEFEWIDCKPHYELKEKEEDK